MRPIAEAYKDFPILHKEHNGHRVIYLDSGATAQIPQSVIDRVVEHMTQRNGNPHRGSHILAIEASEDYENARDRVVAVSYTHLDGLLCSYRGWFWGKTNYR